MSVTLRGFCTKQRRNAVITAHGIDASTLEDKNKPNRITGRFTCSIAMNIDCNGNNCHILSENGYKI